MNKENTRSARGVLASLAMLSQALPALAHATPAEPTLHAPASPEAIRHTMNVASQQMVKSTWLHIPPMCKDRSFAFDPTVVTAEAGNATMTALFAEMDAAPQMQVEGA